MENEEGGSVLGIFLINLTMPLRTWPTNLDDMLILRKLRKPKTEFSPSDPCVIDGNGDQVADPGASLPGSFHHILAALPVARKSSRYKRSIGLHWLELGLTGTLNFGFTLCGAYLSDLLRACRRSLIAAWRFRRPRR